jgi:hypothetical protein
MKTTLDTGPLRAAVAARPEPAHADPRQGAGHSSGPSRPELGSLAELGELAAQRHAKRGDTCLVAPRPMSPMTRGSAVLPSPRADARGNAQAPASGAASAATAAGAPDEVAGASAGKAAQAVAPSSEAWKLAAAHIHNPGNDPRVTKLVTMLETLHRESPTFRARLDRVVKDGGFSLHVSERKDLPPAFTDPMRRRIHLAAEVATDAPESRFRSLPALAVEISNLFRAGEFDALNRHFHDGRLDVAHAARLKETVEYGTVSDMVSFFSEARRGIEKMGFDKPETWYARRGPFGAADIRAAFPTVNDYVKNAIRSGHTAGYERQFSNIAAKMTAAAAAPPAPAEDGQD